MLSTPDTCCRRRRPQSAPLDLQCDVMTNTYEQEEDERIYVALRMDHVRLCIRGCRQPMVDLSTRRTYDQDLQQTRRAELTREAAGGRRRATGHGTRAAGGRRRQVGDGEECWADVGRRWMSASVPPVCFVPPRRLNALTIIPLVTIN
jgi:hypothetical protein